MGSFLVAGNYCNRFRNLAVAQRAFPGVVDHNSSASLTLFRDLHLQRVAPLSRSCRGFLLAPDDADRPGRMAADCDGDGTASFVTRMCRSWRPAGRLALAQF